MNGTNLIIYMHVVMHLLQIIKTSSLKLQYGRTLDTVFHLPGGAEGEQFFQYEVHRSDLSYGNFATIKSNLGYGGRDYLYYKKRCDGGVVAPLEEIDPNGDASNDRK